MKKNQFDLFQKSLSPQTLAIWWVTEGPLTKQTAFFHELDYFFDGLLSRTLDNPDNKQMGLFLQGQSFQTPLFLIHSELAQAEAFLDQGLGLLPKIVEKPLLLPVQIPSALQKKVRPKLERAGLKLAAAID